MKIMKNPLKIQIKMKNYNQINKKKMMIINKKIIMMKIKIKMMNPKKQYQLIWIKKMIYKNNQMIKKII